MSDLRRSLITCLACFIDKGSYIPNTEEVMAGKPLCSCLQNGYCYKHRCLPPKRCGSLSIIKHEDLTGSSRCNNTDWYRSAIGVFRR